MKKNKEPSRNDAVAIIYEKVIYNLEVACIEKGIIASINYVPKCTDRGTLVLAIQLQTALLFVKQNPDAIELSISDYLNYCNELNNTYEDFGFNELTIA